MGSRSVTQKRTITTRLITDVTTDAVHGAPRPLTRSSRVGEHAGATHGVEVASRRVLEGEQTREQRRDHQPAHQVDDPGSDVLLGNGEQHRRGVRQTVGELESPVDHGRRAERSHDGERREAEDHRDQDDRGVGRAGHRLVRVLRLLAVDRRGFEADVRGEGERQSDPGGAREAAGEDVLGEERGSEVDALRLVRAEEDGERGEQEREQLEGHEHAEELGTHVDREHRQAEHDRPRQEGPHVPGPVDAERVVHLTGDEPAEEAEHGELHGEVRHQRHERRADPRDDAEATPDESVERAGVGDLARHRRVADGEQQQDEADDDVGTGSRCAVPRNDRDGTAPVMPTSGAAAATTKNTIPRTPRRPWCRAVSGVSSGAGWSSVMGIPSRSRHGAGADRTDPNDRKIAASRSRRQGFRSLNSWDGVGVTPGRRWPCASSLAARWPLCS